MRLKDNKKLGRGLSALLGEAAKSSVANIISKNSETDLQKKGRSSKEVMEIDLSEIIAGEFQPRTNFKARQLNDLAESIKENGILQPITVRETKNQKFEIVAGERRFRAAKIAGLKKVPVIIHKISDKSALELAIIENVQRDDLSAAEEARGYKKLMEEFSYTQEELSKKIGKSRSHIANLLRLLTLPESVLTMLDREELTMGHARALVGNSDAQKLAKLIIEKGLNVRQIEEISSAKKDSRKQVANKINKKSLTSKPQPINSGANFLQELQQKIQKTSNLQVAIKTDKANQKGELTIKFSNHKQLAEIFESILK